jgi:signal transduction histidine kinase
VGKQGGSMKKVKILSKYRDEMIWGLISAAFGYVILSPFAMVVSDTIHSRMLPEEKVQAMYANPLASIMEVFKPYLIVWGLIFAIFCGIVGYIIGLYIKVKREYTDKLNESYKKLQVLEQLKNSLTHMIVHDLNTPLMVLSGNLQLFEMDLRNSLSDDQYNYIRNALGASQEMKEMISNLLDISRMEEDKLKLNYEGVDTEAVIKEIADSMDILAKEGNKKIIVKVAANMPNIYADKNILKRIISNLIGNALKFAPNGSGIEVAANYDLKENNDIMSVTDHGIGISKEYLDRIFDKFVQVETKEVQRKGGKGLGLTFCKMAVEAHGGRIWVESELGKGSTFYFTIPTKKINE